MLSNDDAQRTKHCQVHAQLGMPGGGHELIEPIVTIRCREQEGIALLILLNFLN